jgi:hypothetical protein
MLHLHNGIVNRAMVPFSETGQMSGIANTNWSWAPLFADYDNDGDKDLIISNGYPRDLTDKDWSIYKSRVVRDLSDERYAINMAPEIKIPNDAYENTDGIHFMKKTTEWMGKIPSFSNGAAFADLDNDGDLDYIVSNINDRAFIMRNYTVENSKDNNHFIKIKLEGKSKNTMAVGAKIEIWAGDRYQFTEHFLSRGYASSVDPVIHFGIGREQIIDSIKVRWPATDKISLLKNVRSDQNITISEMDSLQSDGKAIDVSDPTQIFRESPDVLSYIHEQNDYSDFFQNQKIIPHKFSQIGPVLVKGDIDGDRLDDIITGSTNKQPTSVFLRKGMRFINSEFAGLTIKKEFSEADIAVVDINKDGQNDIVAVAGGYENQDESEYRHYLYMNHNGSFDRISLPVPPFPASAVRTCDLNHDGYPDLFIGSRVKKGMFPFADSSWIVVNDKGRLRSEPWSGSDLGMVTDAVWSDFDKDGWEDLIVTREWNSIAILKNMNGKKLVPVLLPEIEAKSGFWYSVVSGDFDRNGYDDYIVGNLGENNRFNISDKYPLNLYAIDFDLDGIIDPIISGYWPDPEGEMKAYPLNYLDELEGQSAFFRSRFKTYKAFSLATIDDIIDESLKTRIQQKLTVSTTSSYVIWNEKGRFRWEKLPLPLQESPLTKMVVKDINNDTYPDIIVSGNDYSWDVSTGYFDAIKGFVLLSQGKRQSFDVLPPSKSGLLLQGMAGSLLFLDGDTNFVVAGINRSKALVFKQIKNY